MESKLKQNIFSEAQSMEFKNLERNILFLLGNQWLKSGNRGPFDTKWILEKFSDIPQKNMIEALRSINERDFIELTSNDHKISLTEKGLTKIKVIHMPGNGYLPYPRQLE